MKQLSMVEGSRQEDSIFVPTCNMENPCEYERETESKPLIHARRCDTITPKEVGDDPLEE